MKQENIFIYQKKMYNILWWSTKKKNLTFSLEEKNPY